jgi:radical SAM/Cys-rich protein
MRDTVQLLIESDFPVIRRGRLETLQVNLGYKCNQSCLHCHVNAGPNRTEMMDRETLDAVIRFMDDSSITTLDLTGGAPEISPLFRTLVSTAHARGVKVIDRCNLTILLEPGQQDTARFLADHRVRIVASMPCYLKDNVDKQRGDGVFNASLTALRLLNGLGYGQAGSGLELDLVFNPQGALLPPPQQALEQDYKSRLAEHYDIYFNHLLTLTNMPIKRFGSTLVSKGKFDAYMALLREAHQDENLSAVMCRSLVSIDWQGYVYDCDFNQMLDLPTRLEQKTRLHISELQADDMTGNPVRVADHCYGCTAGQGSSCGGALEL